jgi:DNA-binding MarR family transcriptional regulator
MSGIAMIVIDASSVASRTASVVFESAIHLYSSDSPGRLTAFPFTLGTTANNSKANCAVCLPILYDLRVPVRVKPSGLASDLRIVLGQLMRRLRAEHTFSLTQGAVLGRLDREGPQTTAQLAASERVRPQSMGQTLNELEAQALVARRPHETDRRRTLIELTDEGRRVLAEDRRRRVGWLAEAIERDLTPEEQEVMERAVGLLSRLAEL